MKKMMLIAVMLFSLGKAFSQGIYLPTNPTQYGTNFLRIKPLLVQHLPEKNGLQLNTGDTLPQIFFNSANNKVYVWSSSRGYFAIADSATIHATIDTQYIRRDIDLNTAQVTANTSAIQQRIDSIRRLPGTTQVQARKNGVWVNMPFIDSVGTGGAATDTTSLSNRINLKANNSNTVTVNGNTQTLGSNPNFTVSGGGGSSDTLFYNIKSFGADTASANNTTAIQNAINAAHSKGGTVYIPGGSFKTNTLTWYSNVRITGNGKASTLKAITANTPIIKFFGVTNFDNTLNSLTVAFQPIDNIQLDGTGVAGVTGLEMSNSAVMTFNNVRIFKCDTAAKMSGVIIAHFTGCDFEFGKIGLYIKDGIEGGATFLPTNIITVNKCRLTYFSKQAILATQFAALTLNSTNIEQSGTANDATTGGIFLKYPYVTSSEGIGLTLNNCWFEGIEGIMVRLEDGGTNVKHIINNNTFIVITPGTGAINTIYASAPSYVNNIYLSKNQFGNTTGPTIKATGVSNIYFEEPLDPGITKSIVFPATFLPFNPNVFNTTDTTVANGTSAFIGNSKVNIPVGATGSPVAGGLSGINISMLGDTQFGGALLTDYLGNFWSRSSGANSTYYKIITDGNIGAYIPDTTSINNKLNLKQNLITLTNTGTGAPTFTQSTGALNIPTPSGGGGSGWNLTGNAGTVAGTNFIGTTDNIGFMTKVNNLQSGYLDVINNNTSLGYRSMSANTSGYFNTAIGIQSLFNNTTSNTNTAIGYNTMFTNTTGSQNTANGYRALYNNNGVGNTATGSNSLYSNTTGSNNTAIGVEALNINTTGTGNTATGQQSLLNNNAADNSAYGAGSLKANTSGTNNNAFGLLSMQSNTSGINNNAFGVYAMYQKTNGSNNSAFGHQSLFNNTTGNNNVAFGQNVMLLNVSGSQNTALGTNALYNYTGSSSIGIGAFTDMPTNASGQLNFGNGIFASGLYTGTSNTSTAQTAVKVGIGTNSPQYTLDINGLTYMSNQSTPATPTGGGVLFVQGGALKFIGSSGTVTTIAVQ